MKVKHWGAFAGTLCAIGIFCTYNVCIHVHCSLIYEVKVVFTFKKIQMSILPSLGKSFVLQGNTNQVSEVNQIIILEILQLLRKNVNMLLIFCNRINYVKFCVILINDLHARLKINSPIDLNIFVVLIIDIVILCVNNDHFFYL